MSSTNLLAARFTCVTRLPKRPEAIAAEILNLEKWTEFTGAFPLPGIQAAEFLDCTGDVVGSRIRVTNTDGSCHTEEIIRWQPESSIQLKLHEFSPPLSRLASHFVETWEFQVHDSTTLASRTFELFARSQLRRLPVWGISFLLKRAVRKHMRQLRNDAERNHLT